MHHQKISVMIYSIWNEGGKNSERCSSLCW